MARLSEEWQEIEDVVHDLLAKISYRIRRAGFLLPSLSCSQERRGGWRPVIDRSALNKFLIIPHLTMEQFDQLYMQFNPTNGLEA